MHLIGLEMACFVSKSSAVITHVMLGFVPDFVWGIFDAKGTNPLERFWANSLEFPTVWDAAQSLLNTGSTGVLTQDATGIAVFEGGTQITAAEVSADDPRYVDRNGVLVTDTTILTQPGITIPVDHQVNSGKNLILAFRRNS